MNMFHLLVTLFLCFTGITGLSSKTLNGIYVIDSCECNSTNEKCELNGPFIFDQQRSALAVRYGTTQVGVGTLKNNRLALYLNQNHCKGLWNEKSRVAELQCQHPGGIICSPKLRCVSGACSDDASIIVSSAIMTTTFSVLSVISSLFMLIY